MRSSFLIGGIVIAAIIIAALQFWPEKDKTEATQPQTDELVLPSQEDVEVSAEAERQARSLEPSPSNNLTQSGAEAVAIEPTLPELQVSDEWVLEYVSPWSLPPVWLQREDLLARTSVVMLNAAQGRVPRRQLMFLAPPDAYPVHKVGEQIYVDADGYSRYDPLVQVLESIPAEELASFLVTAQPLLEQALVQLGEPQAPAGLVDNILARIEALPLLADDVELLQPNVMYTYADPKLESLPEFEKQLLRMGPQNIRRLQAYAAEFKRVYQPNL